MSAADPFKEIEELKVRHERLQEQADAVKTELAEKRAALQARLDSIAPAPRGVSPMRKRGENLEAVKKALADGLTDFKAIAQRTGIKESNVKRYVLQAKGDAEPDEADEADEAEQPKAAPARLVTANLQGDAIERVRAEILKQGGKGRLMVTKGIDGHTHVADVDRDGAGITTAGGKDRHFHVIRDFVPRSNAGTGPSVHRHELLATAADS
jgi:hypothetical protein